MFADFEHPEIKKEKEESVMEKNDHVRTEGAPLYLGILSAILLLISSILQSGVTKAYTNSILASTGLTMGQAYFTSVSVIGFVIYPGIFLILLLTAIKKPKRGTAFSVVWIIISGISVLFGLKSIFTNSQIKALADQLVPGGFYLYSVLSLLGGICMLFSCILLLQRIQQAKNGQTDDSAEQL